MPAFSPGGSQQRQSERVGGADHGRKANNGRNARLLRALDAAAGGLVTDRYLEALGINRIAGINATFELRLAGHGVVRCTGLGYRLIRRGDGGFPPSAAVSVLSDVVAGTLHAPNRTEGEKRDAV